MLHAIEQSEMLLGAGLSRLYFVPSHHLEVSLPLRMQIPLFTTRHSNPWD